jgi:transcriptional regulator with XRE-family HTH domain
MTASDPPINRVMSADNGESVRVSTVQLGDTIRDLRLERSLSIEELARAADLHPTYLSGIERGKRNPSWAKLADLAGAMKLPVSAVALKAEERCRERMPTASQLRHTR